MTGIPDIKTIAAGVQQMSGNGMSKPPRGLVHQGGFASLVRVARAFLENMGGLRYTRTRVRTRISRHCRQQHPQNSTQKSSGVTQ